MGKIANGDNPVGKRIGRLLRQYALRIAYAEGNVALYEEELGKASAMSKDRKAARARIAREVWAIYADNLIQRKSELEKAVRDALVGYTEKQRLIWWLYFIENKSAPEISEVPEVSTELRKVYRTLSAMRDEMELNFRIEVPDHDCQRLKWKAKDLAEFLKNVPSADYVTAVRDLLDNGLVNLDLLEFDPGFQKHLGEER